MHKDRSDDSFPYPAYIVKSPSFLQWFEGTAGEENPLAEFNVNKSSESASKLSNNLDVVSADNDVTTSKSTFSNFANEDVEIGYSHNARYLTGQTWTTLDLWDTVTSFGDVGALIKAANVNLADRLKTYSIQRYDIKLFISVQGFTAAQGRLVIYALPGPGTGAFDHNTRTNCRIVPHVIIDPSRSASYELVLPFCGENGSYLNGTSYSTWRLFSRVYDPLDSGMADSNDAIVQIFGSLENVQLSGKIVPMSHDFSTLEDATRAIQEVAIPIVTKISPYVTLASRGIKATALALKTFGFSKPNVVDYQVSRIVTSENYSQTSGTSKATVLGPSQIPNSSIYPTIAGGTERDMELSYMLGHPAYIGRYLSSSLDATGLSYVPLKLDLMALDLYSGTGCDTEVNPALFTLMAQTHVGCSGVLRVNLEFITSIFVRASYIVAWAPPGSKLAPTMGEATAMLENVVVQVSGNTSISLDIPYRRPQLTGFDFGSLYVFLLAPVNGQGGGSVSRVFIDVLLDCSRIQFHTPCNRSRVAFTDPIPEEAKSSEDVPESEPMSNDWIESPVTSFGPPNEDPSVFVGGDSPKVVKDLTSRMGLVQRLTLDTGAYIVYGSPWPVPAKENVRASLLSIFISMFYGARGSIRISLFHSNYNAKVITRLRGGTYVGPWSFGASNINLYDYVHAVTSHNLGLDTSADIVVPYYSPQNFISTSKPLSEQVPQTLYVDYNGATGTLDVLQASGDDFVFSNFLGVPTFAFYY